MDIINSILTGGVAVAIITLIGQIIMWYLNNKKTNDDDDVNAIDSILFEHNTEIQGIIDRVLNRTTASRFLILKTENGGGKPRIGTHLYVSVIYESIKSPMSSVKNDYQRLLIDPIYVKMLSSISISTPHKLNANKMKDGILKSMYQKEGVVYSEVHFIDETDNAFYFLSIESNDEKHIFDNPNDRVEIEIAVSKIRNIFSKTIHNE